MAIQRNSEAAQIGTKDTRQYTSPNIAPANIRPDYVTQVGDTNWKGNLIGNLVGLTTQVAKIQFDNASADAYLKGAAQAGINKVESELQADPFTKDFATAGFRDSMGKLKSAQQEADLAGDMAWLREQPPEKMQEYLNKQRNELMPILEGMSGAQRASMIPQVALRDQAAIARHAGEYQGFVFETKGKALSTPIVTGLNTLTALREAGASGEAYQAKERTIVGQAIAMWADSTLPRKHKEALTKELVEYSLTNQHLGLYHALRDDKVPDTLDDNGNWTASGNATSILERMDLKTQESLSGAYLKAKEATAARGYQSFMDNLSIQHAAIKNGTSQLDHEQWMAYLDSATSQGLIKQGQRDDMVQDWERMQYKKTDGISAGTAYLTGGADKIFALNKDWNSAGQDADAILAKLPMPEQLDLLSKAVVVHGNMHAATKFGERVNQPIMSLSTPDGKITQEGARTLATFNAVADGLKQYPGQAAQLYAGMNEQAAFRAKALRAQHEAGFTPEVALANVLEIEKAASGKTPQVRAILAAQVSKEDEKYVQSIGTAGFWQRTWWAATSPFSRENAVRGGLERNAPLVGTAGDPTNAAVRDLSIMKVQNAMREELDYVSLTGRISSSEDRVELAMANVIKRSLETSHGTIIMPTRSTPHSYFGFTDKDGRPEVSTPTALIEKAISNRFKPVSEGGRIELNALPQGLQWQEYDRNGTPVPGRGGNLPKDVIVKDTRDLGNKELQPIREQVGEGIKLNRDGVNLQYNGVNTAGVSPASMLQFRKDLVAFEDVKRIAYEDLSNKDRKPNAKVWTVGVGVSTTNPHFPKLDANGVASDEAINTSFKMASNEAAAKALKIQNSVGIHNEAAFLLFGQFAYQGTYGTDKYFAAMKARDSEAAMAALKQTKAYGYARGARRKRYEQLTLEALKG